ncbi:MAG: hypothetical protein Q9196_005284 [Gyalolechia fulgens]
MDGKGAEQVGLEKGSIQRIFSPPDDVPSQHRISNTMQLVSNQRSNRRMNMAAEDPLALIPGFDAMASKGMTSDDLLDWLDTEESKRHGVYLAQGREEFTLKYPEPINIFLSPTPSIISSSPPPVEFSQVQEASAAGDLATVKSILDHWDRNMDSFSSSFVPALDNGHVDVASCLLEHGVSVEGVHFKRAMELKLYSFLERCLRHGFNINDYGFPFRPTPLAECLGDEEMTRWLLDHGADPNAESVINGAKMGETPLSISMLYTPFSTIQLLFERGGPESIKYGQLLWYAVERKLPDRVEVLEYLLAKGAAVDLKRLQYHDRPGPAMQADWVLGRQTPLHGAARNGDLHVVKLFVAWGADPTMPDSKGRLAIDEARKQRRMKESGIIDTSTGHEEVIEYFESLSILHLSLL